MKNSFSALFRMATVSLCAVLVLSLAACGDKPSTSSDGDISAETTSASKSSKTKKPKTTTATTSAASDKTTTTAGGGATQQVATTQKKTTTKATESYWKKTTKAETPLSKYNLKAADYILNPQLHKTKYFGGSEAYPHVRWQGPFVDSSAGLYGRGDDLILYSLEYYGFFNDVIFKGNTVAEWGANYLLLDPGQTAGLGAVLTDDVGFRKKTPKNKKDALDIIEEWLFRQYKNQIVEGEPWDSCPGVYLFNHYAGEWGADSFGAEVGENICHSQASIAFARGAARTYNTPFYIDISPWYGGYHNAHSPSFHERTAMASYMGGAGFVMAEGGEYCLLDSAVSGDVNALNAVGRVYKKVVNFMEKYPNLGYSYTPFALVLDYYHGTCANERYDKKVFNYFDYTDADYMTWNLIDMFFPEGWGWKWNESDYSVNGPYGDTCDGLMQNAPQEVLNSYPCLILSGDIRFTAEEINRYVNYVKQGGTLLMNTAYLPQFDGYKSKYGGTDTTKEIADGKGKVIVYGPDYDLSALDAIIREQYARFVPFTISQQIEHLVNVKDGVMYVTLINNEGYTKLYQENPVIDNTKTKKLTVTYTGNLAVKSVSEIYNKTKVSLNGKSVSISVKPGEVKVLEFKFD